MQLKGSTRIVEATMTDGIEIGQSIITLARERYNTELKGKRARRGSSQHLIS